DVLAGIVHENGLILETAFIMVKFKAVAYGHFQVGHIALVKAALKEDAVLYFELVKEIRSSSLGLYRNKECRQKEDQDYFFQGEL
ncbi:MAG TPA: hypothetical protein DDW81_03530, partial [Cryomorphaceae bacterium]|nr:hypothetical protein [Cryomorphaceae bacterium]